LWTFLFIYIWLRGSLPRLRYDQFMALGWKLLIPVSLVWVLIAAVIRSLRDQGYQYWTAALVISSIVVAIALVLSLRRPFSGPSARALARQRRQERPESIGTDPAFPTPPLPASVGASKENGRG